MPGKSLLFYLFINENLIITNLQVINLLICLNLEIKKLYSEIKKSNESEPRGKLPINKSIGKLFQTLYQKKKFNKNNCRASQLNMDNSLSREMMNNSLKEEDNNVDEEEDLIVEREKLTPSNEIFLTFSKNQPMLIEEFQNSLLINFKAESQIFLGALVGISLIQTLIMISVSTHIEKDGFILSYRGSYVIFNFLGFLIISYINKRRTSKIFLVLIYFYGIVMCLVQINFSMIKEIEEISLLEIIFIYLIFATSTYCKFCLFIFIY